MNPEIVSTLLAQRQILLQGTLDGNKQEEISAAILYLNAINNASPITLFIDSSGGNEIMGGYVCDAIRTSNSPVHGIVIALCGSAAFDILQACRRRIANKNAQLLFHSTRIRDLRVSANRRKMIRWLDEARLRDQRVIRLLARRTSQPLKQLRKWAEEEKTFTASEALKFKFIDEIR